MKYYILSIAFIGFAFSTKAQSDIKAYHDFRQKQFLDSLRNTHKQPAILINPTPRLVYNMPAVLLPNTGEKAGMSEEDTIFQMKTDNMRLLKPNRSTTKFETLQKEK